jgi:hypothetical protein
MTKQDYLNALREKMRGYPADFQNEICEAFEGHFAEGLENGQSEDEIIDSLGTVDDVMENIRMMNLGNEARDQRQENLRSSLDSLSSSLHDTIRSVSSIVTDSVNMAVKNIESYKAEEKANESEGKLDVTDGTVLKIKGTRRGALDVFLDTGSTLSFRFKPSRSLFSSSCASLQVSQSEGTVLFEADDNAHLWLEIPEEVEEIRINLLSGDVEVRNLTLKSLQGRTVSGDWEFDDCRIRLLSVDTKSGDIDLDDTECADIELVSYSGDLSLQKTSGNLEAKTASGDIDLDRHRADRLKAESMSGDLDVYAVSPQIELITVSGDIELNSGGRAESISCTATSGDICARIGDTDYTAVLRTVSGDISNETDLPEVKRSSKEYVIGDGLASVMLRSTSGDISLE